MAKATGVGVYTVRMTARCEMVVEVHASSKAQAERLADALEYSLTDASDFTPVDWEKVRVVRGSAKLSQPTENPDA